MAQKAIHVNSAPTDPLNIRAEDEAAWLTALTNGTAGSVSGVLPWGNRLAAQKVSDNRVRLQPGLYSMQGFVLKLDAAEDFTIQSGAQGRNRIDLIVAEYRKGAERDTYALKVITGTQSTGTATAPALTTQDLHFGGNLRQEEVARVLLSGTSISSFALTAPVLKGLGELMTLLTDIIGGATKVGNADKLDGHDSTAFLLQSNYTAADVLSKIKTVDGAGSELDADLLDGYQAAAFCMPATVNSAVKFRKMAFYTSDNVDIDTTDRFLICTNQKVPQNRMKSGATWAYVRTHCWDNAQGVTTEKTQCADATDGSYTATRTWTSASGWTDWSVIWKVLYGTVVPALLNPGQLFIKV